MNATTTQTHTPMAVGENAHAATSCGLPALTRPAAIASWLLQILSAAVLAQALFFKFSGAEEPVYIFTTLGVEPWGRIAAAVSELIAVVLLLVPRTSVLGAAMSIGIMLGALGAHFGPLGIVVKDDGGLLFALAPTVFAACSIVLFLRRAQAIALFHAALNVAGIRPSGARARPHA